MLKILIADDSRFQRQLLASLLSSKDFEPLFAVDALQAWMAALRSAPQLILLDINMPGGTGIEVLKRLRMSTKTQHIPVIVVSRDRESRDRIDGAKSWSGGFSPQTRGTKTGLRCRESRAAPRAPWRLAPAAGRFSGFGFRAEVVSVRFHHLRFTREVGLFVFHLPLSNLRLEITGELDPIGWVHVDHLDLARKIFSPGQ